MFRISLSLAFILLLVCAAGAQVDATPAVAPGTAFVAFDFPGAVSTRGYRINNKAEIVGSYVDSQSNTVGFYLSAQGKFRKVDPLHTGYSAAYAINDNGIIGGTYEPNFGQESFVLDASGHYHAIPLGVNTGITGINNLRDIVGSTWNCCSFHGFLLRHGQLTIIDYPGSHVTSAASINDGGVIVGAWDDASEVTHGFKLEGDVFTQIDVPGAAKTYTVSINSAGTISGFYVDSSNLRHGFILRNGVFQTVDVPGAISTEISGINDVGMIVGNFTDTNGVRHGFFGRR